MLLIAAPICEKTVNDVIDWLYYYSLKFERLEDLDSLSNTVYIRNKSLNSNITSFWSRKVCPKPLVFKQDYNYILTQYLQKEKLTVFEHSIFKYEEINHLGNYFSNKPNKLLHLELAKKSNLSIPDTLITSNKDLLIEFKKKHKNIINKSINDFYSEVVDNVNYYNHTQRVTEEIIDNLEETFFPSLFQEELDKKYELRIVFIRNKLWAMVIFSQNNVKTLIDWRNLDNESAIRFAPFNLHNILENKIKQFIKLSGLNIGVIDIVVSKKNEFFFLECNPNGNIDMVSRRCNYNIEEYIALLLNK